MKTPRPSSGFTLIEVLIAITILAFLSAMTGQAIQRSLQFKKKIQADIDVESRLRSAMRMVERDIALAFHYRNLDAEIRAETAKILAKAGEPTPTPVPNGEEVAPTTIFKGESGKINLTTVSHVRTDPEAQESNQAEVGYFLEGCRFRKGQSKEEGSTGQCLMRRETPYLDGDVEKGGTTTEMLPNVKTFSLKYYGEGKQDWVTSWNSLDSRDDATRGNFPLAVEVELVVEEKKKEYSIAAVIPIRFPNNEDKAPSTGSPPQ